MKYMEYFCRALTMEAWMVEESATDRHQHHHSITMRPRNCCEGDSRASGSDNNFRQAPTKALISRNLVPSSVPPRYPVLSVTSLWVVYPTGDVGDR